MVEEILEKITPTTIILLMVEITVMRVVMVTVRVREGVMAISRALNKGHLTPL